jgi:ankyrin repeat protein
VGNEEPELHRAARVGDRDAIRGLVAAGVDADAEGVVNGYQTTAIALAAGSQDGATAETLKLLLELGADPNVGKYMAATALENAARTGDAERVRVLLDGGADVSEAGIAGNVLVSAGSTAVFELLLEAGADPTVPTRYDGSIVRCVADLDSSSLDERVAMLGMLRVVGVEIDAVQPGDDGDWPPLCRAAFSDSARGVEALLAAGANPILDVGIDPLGHAVWGRDYNTENEDTERKVDLLVAAGCAVDRLDASGLTPLHGALMPYSHGSAYASSDGLNVPGAAALIGNGASIDIAFSNGRVPLHIAADNACPNGVDLLLTAGADPRARDDEGRMPVDHARRSSTGWATCRRLTRIARSGRPNPTHKSVNASSG